MDSKELRLKALIIDEPWISKILSGEKIWEMRKSACHQHGEIGLIRKGSGQVVSVAEIAGSLPTLETALQYAAAEPKHRIPPDRQLKAFADGWRTPWVVENARPLSKPIRYQHPFGAVIWVNLDQSVTEAIVAELAHGIARDGGLLS